MFHQNSGQKTRYRQKTFLLNTNLAMFSFLERFPMEHIQTKCSIESQLFFVSICSIRIPLQNTQEIEKTDNRTVAMSSKTFRANQFSTVFRRTGFQSGIDFFEYISNLKENLNRTYRDDLQLRIKATKWLYMSR